MAGRNRGSLTPELIGGICLASVVSLVVFFAESASQQSRNDLAESLTNSPVVREAVMSAAVMSERATLPFSALLLAGAQLRGVALDGADCPDADLTGADMIEATLAGGDLTVAVHVEVAYDEADPSGAWHSDAEPPAADAALLMLLTAVNAEEAEVDNDRGSDVGARDPWSARNTKKRRTPV